MFNDFLAVNGFVAVYSRRLEDLAGLLLTSVSAGPVVQSYTSSPLFSQSLVSPRPIRVCYLE